MVKKHFAVALLFFVVLIISLGCAKKHPLNFIRWDDFLKVLF